MFDKVFALIKKDFCAEWIKSKSIGANFLYSISAFVFCYFLYTNSKGIGNNWDVIYWILLLFASINSSSRNFSSETKGKLFQYYLLSGASVFCNSKIVYNFATISIIAILNLILSKVFGVLNIENNILFLLLVSLASLGIAIIMVFVNLIAIKTNNNYALTALLSFPLLLPLIYIIYKTSTASIYGTSMQNAALLILLIVFFDIAIYILTIILAPFVWTD